MAYHIRNVKLTEETRMARKTYCEYCKAEPGQVCTNGKGEGNRYCHTKRVQRALAFERWRKQMVLAYGDGLVDASGMRLPPMAIGSRCRAIGSAIVCSFGARLPFVVIG